MVISLVELSVKWMNDFQTYNRLSSTIITDMILQGKPNPELNKKIIVFGYFAVVYIGTNKTMKCRIIP